MGLAEVKQLALDLGGLIHAHDFQETSGSTLDDFSGGGLDSTITAAGTPGGAALIAGAARSLTCAATPAATRVVTGTAIQTLTHFTALGLVQPSSNGASRGFLDRGEWGFRQTTVGQVTAYLRLNGSFIPGIQSWNYAPANVPTMIALSFGQVGNDEGQFLQLHMNGVPDIKSGPLTGSLSTVATAPLVFGNNAGAAMPGLRQLHLIFDRRLTHGEQRELAWAAGSVVDRQGGVFFDYAQDGEPIVAASATAGACHVTGGLMRVAEASRIPSGTTRRRQPSMRRIEAGGAPALTASSDQEDWAPRILAHGLERIMALAFRANPSRGAWHDGTKFTGASGDQPGNFAGLGALAATMAKFIHGGSRGARGSASPDPLIALARRDLQYLYSLSSLPTSYHVTSGEFSLAQMARMVHALEGLIPRGEWEQYVEDYLAFCSYFHTNEGEGTYIVNGNREVGEHVLYVYANLWDPATWGPRLDAHWDFTINPPAGARGSPGGPVPFGFVTVVAPTEDNGSDGRGYLRESHGAVLAGNPPERAFWNWGSTAENDATRETVNVNGESKEYTGLQCQFASHGWLVAKNGGMTVPAARLEWLANMTREQLRTHVDTSTWIVDASYGSRHTTNFTWGTAFDQVLTWAGSRSDLDPGEWPGIFENWLAARRAQYRTPDQGLYRDAQYQLGSLLMSMDSYPWS